MMFKNFIFLVTLMVYSLLLPWANEMLWADEPVKTMQAELTADAHWEIDEGQNTRVGTMHLNAATTLELDRTPPCVRIVVAGIETRYKRGREDFHAIFTRA